MADFIRSWARAASAAAVAAALLAPFPAGARTMGQSSELQRMTSDGALTGCGVALVVFPPLPDGSDDSSELLIGNLQYRRVDQLYVMALSFTVRRGLAEGAQPTQRPPATILVVVDGQDNRGETGHTIRSSTNPDYGLGAFPVDAPLTAAALRGIASTGLFTFAYRVEPGDPLRTVEVSIADRENGPDPAAIGTWNACIEDLRRGSQAPAAPGG